MSVCECKLSNYKSIFKSKCKVCKFKLCDSCAKSALCGLCTLVKNTNLETKELLALSEENLLEIASFFHYTLIPYTLTKFEVVNIILKAKAKRPKKLRKLSKIQLRDPISVSCSSDDSIDEEEFENTCSSNYKEDVSDWVFVDNITIEDVPNLSTKELKKHLERLNVDLYTCIEKQDFVDLLILHLKKSENQECISKRCKKYSTSDVRNIHVSSYEIKSEKGENETIMKKHFSFGDISNLEEIPLLSIKQLKSVLTEMSIDCQNMCEKSELTYRVAMLFHQFRTNGDDEILAKSKIQRTVSKRNGFYVKAENNIQTENIKILTLEDIKSADMIESLPKNQLKQVLINNSPSGNEIEYDSMQQWELAFKVLQLWTAYRTSKEEDLRRCIVCCEADISCTILECGHTITCSPCGLRLNTCPMCNGNIERIVKIFKP